MRNVNVTVQTKLIFFVKITDVIYYVDMRSVQRRTAADWRTNTTQQQPTSLCLSKKVVTNFMQERKLYAQISSQ